MMKISTEIYSAVKYLGLPEEKVIELYAKAMFFPVYFISSCSHSIFIDAQYFPFSWLIVTLFILIFVLLSVFVYFLLVLYRIFPYFLKCKYFPITGGLSFLIVCLKLSFVFFFVPVSVFCFLYWDAGECTIFATIRRKQVLSGALFS